MNMPRKEIPLSEKKVTTTIKQKYLTEADRMGLSIEGYIEYLKDTAATLSKELVTERESNKLGVNGGSV